MTRYEYNWLQCKKKELLVIVNLESVSQWQQKWIMFVWLSFDIWFMKCQNHLHKWWFPMNWVTVTAVVVVLMRNKRKKNSNKLRVRYCSSHASFNDFDAAIFLNPNGKGTENQIIASFCWACESAFFFFLEDIGHLDAETSKEHFWMFFYFLILCMNG